jgi:nucleotide-binding universal stress UspA family protein
MRKLEKILFFVDGEPSITSLERVVKIAAAYDAALTVASVIPPVRSQLFLSKPTVDPEELERLLVDDCRRQLDEALESAGDPEAETKAVVLVGHPLKAIVRYVEEHGIDYLMKEPSPSDGLREQLFGSIDLRLMRSAPCLVGIGPPRKTEGRLRAVFAVDVDTGDERKAELNREILDSVLLAQVTEIFEVYVVHAWDLYGYSILAHGRGKVAPMRLEEALEEERSKREQWLESFLESYRRSLDPEQAAIFEPTPVLLQGDPKVVIPRKVRELEADLVCLGTAARGGFGAMMMSNTAEEILHRVHCTVVVHKARDFESPLECS